MTIEQLMENVGCSKWPERWNTLYEDVRSDFEKNGCLYLTPEYYDETAEKYGVFSERLALYKEAAARVAEREELALFFHLLCRALENRETAYAEILACKLPKSKEGEPDLALDMLEGLAIFSEIPYCYGVLKKIGLPEDYIRSTLRRIEYGVADYESRNGTPGYALLYWNQLIIDGKLFRVGRLELELCNTCYAGVSVFEGQKGMRRALVDGVRMHKDGYTHGIIFYEDEEGAWDAAITETEDSYIGYEPDGTGHVPHTLVTLSKSEWRRILSPCDKVVSIHIPADGKLDDEAVKATYPEMQKFLKTYFPDFDYKAFYCASWLLDPTLEDLLGENANIARFGRGFRHRFIARDTGYGVFHFAFRVKGKPGADYPFDDLPETTRLFKAVKEHYKGGRGIYAVSGVFFPDELP